MKKARLFVFFAALLMAALLFVSGCAEEAEDISARCAFKGNSGSWKATRLTNKDYNSYWQSGEAKNPYLCITSPEPMQTLYLCFHDMPQSYELQRRENGEWVSFIEGDTRFHHICYDVGGETEIRILSTQKKKHRLAFNEIFVFGPGELPDWVQHWEETEEKADLLLLVAHPDDELIFFAGLIPTYDVEMGKRVVVAYMTYANGSRRSEALNGLWSMGVRTYPVFGPIKDQYSTSLNTAYKKAGKKKVLTWVTELFRQYRPEVVVTHDIKGEYGHGQHRMMADAGIRCYELAADAANYPESAEQYGVWEVKKLYIHRYGDKADRLYFGWDQPLQSLGGKTGMELAIDAFAKHVSQQGLTFHVKGRPQPLTVDGVGGYYENTDFGLYASRVGEDVARNDFLEHIE